MSNVNHPEHYGGDTTYETIKVIEAWKLDFHLGNAVKYISRAGKKDDAAVDIQKAIWYLQRFLDLERVARGPQDAQGRMPSIAARDVRQNRRNGRSNKTRNA